MGLRTDVASDGEFAREEMRTIIAGIIPKLRIFRGATVYQLEKILRIRKTNVLVALLGSGRS